MKKTTIAVAITLASCGYSAKGNELIGQVKKVVEKTPLICGDYVETDLSLGIMRNGVGSLSKEDVVLYVVSDADVAKLKAAAESGQPVKVAYDIRRVAMCVPDHWLTSVTVLEAEQAK